MSCELSSKLINTFVLPQFDGSQMIPRIEIGRIFPCLHISFSVCTLLSTLIILIVCDCRTNFISSPLTIILKKKRYQKGCIYNSTQSETAQYSKCFFVSNNCDVHSLIAKELKYIPKIILLREFKNYRSTMRPSI